MNTKEKILQIAKEEFVDKGFKNTSMRQIATRVGITATALYRHYENKEKIFDAVVAPAYEAWEKFCDEESVRQTDIARNESMDAMWDDESQLHRVVDMIYENLEEQKLLFCQSKGTKYEDFLHRLVTRVQTETMEFMSELKASGVNVKDVEEREMHLLLSAEYSAIFEILDHDFNYEEAYHYVQTVTHFFTFGWRDYFIGG